MVKSLYRKAEAEVLTEPLVEVNKQSPVVNKPSAVNRNAYMREYMRKRRAAQKDPK